MSVGRTACSRALPSRLVAGPLEAGSTTLALTVSVACVTLTGPSRAQHKAAVREPNCCTIFGGSPYSIFSPWREIEFSSLSMQICPSRGSPQPQQGLDRLPPQARGAGPNPGRAHLPLMHKSSRQVTGAPGEWPVPQAGLTSTCSVPPRRVGLDPPQKRQDPAPSSKPWLSCLSHRVSHQHQALGRGRPRRKAIPHSLPGVCPTSHTTQSAVACGHSSGQWPLSSIR